MASLADLETRINGMMDLSTAEIDKVFTEPGGAAVNLTSLSNDDLDSFYKKFEEKSLELFEKIKIAGSVGSTFADVKRDVTVTGRFDAAKGDTLENALKDKDKKMSDIESFISGLRIDTDQADIEKNLNEIDNLKLADVRKEYFNKLTTKAVDVYGQVAEYSDAVSQGTTFLRFVAQTVGTNNRADVASLITENDFINNVDDEWKNNQAAKIGPNYKSIYDEEKRLKNLLGSNYDSTKPDSAEVQITKKIDDLKDTGPVVIAIKDKYKTGLALDIERIVNNVDEFIEVASNEEIDDFLNNIDEFKASLTGPSVASLSAKYDAAKTKVEDEKTNRATAGHARHGHTGIDDAALEAEINTLLGDLPGLEAARDAAKAALDKENHRINFEEKDNGVLVGLQSAYTASATPLSADDQLKLDAINDILTHRSSLDPSLQRATSALEADVTTLLGSGSLPADFAASVEIANRTTLQDYLNLDLAGLRAISQADIQTLFSYSTAVSDEIWNNIQTEISGRDAALNRSGHYEAKEKFADKSVSELEIIADEVERGVYAGSLTDLVEYNDGRSVTPSDVSGRIRMTVAARKGMAQAWFESSALTTAGALNAADLNRLSEIQEELDKRKGNTTTLNSDYTDAQNRVDEQNNKISAARNRRTIRGFADTLHTNLDARNGELAANEAKRNSLIALLGDAKDYDKQAKYKKALIQVMHDVENKFNGQSKVEESAVENEVKSHSVFQAGGDLAAHPNKDALIQELTKELHKRVNKVKTATNSGKKPSKWAKAIAGAVGLVTGLGLSCVPGVSTITMGVLNLRLMYKGAKFVAGKALNAWTSKHPTGKVANIRNKVSTWVNGNSGIAKAIQGVRKFMGDSRTQWFLNGATIGINLGDILDLEGKVSASVENNPLSEGKTSVSVENNPLSESATSPITDLSVLKLGVENDISSIVYGHVGPGHPPVVMNHEAMKHAIFDFSQVVNGETWIHMRQPSGKGLAHFTVTEFEAAGFDVTELLGKTVGRSR